MSRIKQSIANFLREEDGVTATEYAVLIAVILIAIVKAAQVLGVNMKGSFEFIADAFA